MKILIGCDMEGASGVCHREHLMPGGDDYEAARRWYTSDVVAAAEGALDAGASEVWVEDGHGTMRNLLVEAMPPDVRLVSGPAQTGNKPLIQVTSIEHERFAACMLVGFHSRAGTPGGLLAHTWVGALVHEIRLQGRPAGEILLDAAIVGHYGVPVILATGADEAMAEARADLGEDLRTVEVKKSLGPTACASYSPAFNATRIRAAATEAVRALGERTPLRIEAPVEIEVDFHRREMAARAARTGEGASKGDRTRAFTGEDVPSVVKQVWRALEMAISEDAGFLR